MEDEDTEDTFATYEPVHFKGGQPHPDHVVETTSLSFAELPPVKYSLSLPAGVCSPFAPLFHLTHLITAADYTMTILV